MAVFEFTALDARGKEHTGSLEASDARSAAEQMRARSWMVLELGERQGVSAKTSASPAGGEGSGFFGWLPVRTAERVFLLRHMALMLRSGLTVIAALDAGLSQASKWKVRRALRDIRASIEQGESLSSAFEAEGKLFPELVVRLVGASELGGELDAALERAADHLEKQAEVRTKLISSITYPAIVVVVSLATAAFLIVKIIPEFSRFLAQRNVALPWSTQQLVNLSDFFKAHGVTFIIVVNVVVISALIGWTLPRSRLVMDRWLLRIPIVGRLVKLGELSRVSWTMSLLLKSGITVLAALQLVARLVSNRHLSHRLEVAAEDVLRGDTLAESLVDPAIPPLVTQVVGVGEKTGALVEVLTDLGVFYDAQMETSIRRMSALIEPVLILVIGGMVGFVYFAFFQAVLSIATS